MGKFVNYYELSIIMLVILLFDLNAFCYMTLPYIVSGNTSYIMFYLALFFILFDSYIIHRLLTEKHKPEKDIYYHVISESENDKPNYAYSTKIYQNLQNQSKTIRKITFLFIITVFIGLLLVRNKQSYNLAIKIPLGLSIAAYGYYIMKELK